MSFHRTLNLCLLALWPVAWVAPLAHAALLPLFGTEEVSVLSGIAVLWEDEPLLAAIVALFAMVLPMGKTAALALLHAGRLAEGRIGLIETLGRFSMADIFLIALYVVVAKGVGVGSVETGWGLWLFTACVFASFWASHATARELAKTGNPG